MVERAEQGAPPPLGDLGAETPLALFLDFDGTLVELAPTPAAISVPAGLSGRLEQLAARLEGRLALVSGRSVADISSYLAPLSLAIAGSHGLERQKADGSRLGPPPAVIPPAATEQFRHFAEGQAGLNYEAKHYGAALHYRLNPALADEADAFAQRVADEHGLAVKHGKCVVEIVPPGTDKGSAVVAFMQERTFSGARPVFVGDDITDEDGFKAAIQLGGFGIVVGERQETVAEFRLPSPAGVHRWLGL